MFHYFYVTALHDRVVMKNLRTGNFVDKIVPKAEYYFIKFLNQKTLMIEKNSGWANRCFCNDD